MASSPITSWQIEGENVEGLTDFISWVPKITEDNDSSHEIKRCLLLGRKAGLKLNIQKTKIMASSPFTLWQIDGKTMEIARDFIFLGSKITVVGDCSHEIK